MKWIAGLLMSMFALIQTILPLAEVDRPVEITKIEATPTMDFINEKTTLNLKLTIHNGHHNDINSTTLLIDTFLEGVFKERITMVIEDDIRHFYTLDVEKTQVFNDIFFDEITIVSIHTLEKTFFQSYITMIVLGLFYNFILLYMWLVFDRHQNYILSEVNEVLKKRWYYAIIIVLIIPMITNVLGLVGRYFLLSSIFGWVYYVTVIITFPVFYGGLMLYHYLEER